jgi:hypothetical protein
MTSPTLWKINLLQGTLELENTVLECGIPNPESQPPTKAIQLSVI